MKIRRSLVRNEEGVAAIEMAFALPVLIVMIWMFVQLAQVYRATAGIQQGLGEGARFATLCLNPTATGCTIPTDQAINDKINASVYGIGPGNFDTPMPVCTNDTVNGGAYYDLKVNYTQHTSLLLFPGPDISVSRSKRVWVSTSACPAS
jgi:Flp pilus assembly protein TadG